MIAFIEVWLLIIQVESYQFMEYIQYLAFLNLLNKLDFVNGPLLDIYLTSVAQYLVRSLYLREPKLFPGHVFHKWWEAQLLFESNN